jgi:hypothetical protein
MLELVNNPKTYAIMYHLTQLMIERKRVAGVVIDTTE